jgi:hypothetical protein
MSALRSFFRFKPTPRQMGFYAGALGAFGTASYGFALAAGAGLSRFDAAYYLAMSLLFLGAGLNLWHSSTRGWWLGWVAMLSAGFSGFATETPQGWSPDQFPALFFGGFMLAAAGVFFSLLAHPDVYGPCFASVSLPHPVFGATPALLIIAGGTVLTVAGGEGFMAGPFVLVATLIFARWLFAPLWALLRGCREWHTAFYEDAAVKHSSVEAGDD